MNVTAISAPTRPWYRVLNRRQWNTLIVANLGWLFDGYETYALILTVGLTFQQLLPAESHARIPFYAGLTIAVTLLGWGVGGIGGGILADYIGRKRTLIYSILGYSLVTGCTALAWDSTSFVALRFIVGLALGAEWGTGTSMWPAEHRGKGAGLMQCGLGIGFFCASAVWFFISGLGPSAWRWMYVIGILPALATWWIRRGLVESDKWTESDRRRREAIAAETRGERLDEADRQLAQFTLLDLFANSRTRQLTIVAFLMSTTTTLACWGISTWVPAYVSSLAMMQGLPGARWASLAGMCYNLGAICGYIGLGFCADRWGRKPVTIAWFALALHPRPFSMDA